VKSKILIVDDNSMLRETTRSILNSNLPAVRIFEAVDGKEALAQIIDHQPDLVLMDIRLPGENGLTLTRKIKAVHPKIIIIVFTNHDLPEYHAAAFEHGADFFISKSSPKMVLSRLVESIFADARLKQP
jgi:DNA-binding NarL/FixJ family response regulator